MSAETRLFLCRSDNFGVLLHDPPAATASIDAPEAAPVSRIKRHRLEIDRHPGHASPCRPH